MLVSVVSVWHLQKFVSTGSKNSNSLRASHEMWVSSVYINIYLWLRDESHWWWGWCHIYAKNDMQFWKNEWRPSVNCFLFKLLVIGAAKWQQGGLDTTPRPHHLHCSRVLEQHAETQSNIYTWTFHMRDICSTALTLLILFHQQWFGASSVDNI